MKRKSTLALLVFSSAVSLAVYAGAHQMTLEGEDGGKNNTYIVLEDQEVNLEDEDDNQGGQESSDVVENQAEDDTSDEEKEIASNDDTSIDSEEAEDDSQDKITSSSLEIWSECDLIYNPSEIDYYEHVPEIEVDGQVKTALEISNPDISVSAKAAILIDANTKEVLFHKNACEPVFPASTSKVLSSLVVLDWCKVDEEVHVGEEVTYIAPDSSVANIKKGQVLTIGNLLEGMLLPSGNDAAYVAAAHVGRKSLEDSDAPGEEAVGEFVRLMNVKAQSLGASNSCFKTPDGYDAIGQYTTAYDMSLIGLAATENKTIMEICNKPFSTNTFISGESITWKNTNALINPDSGKYHPYAKGLKTGTSTMAGKCLIACASNDGKEVLCVILDSTSAGRFNDAITLIDHGIE